MMKSLEVGYWVDEEPYELSDAFPAAQVIAQSLSFLHGTGFSCFLHVTPQGGNHG